MRLEQGKAHIGMKVLSGWSVKRASQAQVVIYLPSTRDLGYKCGKPLTFKWDGEGYKRQGQYLTVNSE